MLTVNCSEGQFICFYRTAVPPFITFPKKSARFFACSFIFLYLCTSIWFTRKSD